MDKVPVKFEEFRSKRQSVTELCRWHFSALELFHLKGDKIKKNGSNKILGFYHLLSASPGGDRVSIASTATCIKSLSKCQDFSQERNSDYSALLGDLLKRSNNNELKTSDLVHGNAFTVGLLLPVLKTMNADPASPIVQTCINLAENHIKQGGVCIGAYPANGYLTYWILNGLSEWKDIVNEKDKNKFDQLCQKALDWSKTEFYQQISLFSSNTDEESDAFQLGYNFLIQYKYRRDDLRETVIKLALKTLFAAQLKSGLWEKKEPLFVYGEKGDAYCFSFELLTALLTEFQCGDNIDALNDHEEKLDRALKWAHRNKKKKDIPVWRSGNIVTDRDALESWATAEIYLFAQLYRAILSHRIQISLLDSFKAVRNEKSDKDAFADLYQPEVKLVKETTTKKLDELLKDRLLEPLKLLGPSSSQYSISRWPESERKKRIISGILFGPPGTGKTTYVKAMAKYLGWPLVILDPSDFAKEGMHLLPNVTARIFEYLLELEDTVIFFDEMEEMIRERKDPGGAFEQKFLTTCLLPKLQYLHDRANCIFLVATNHFEDLDIAARREGRFDFRILVKPPCYEEKIRMLKTQLGPIAIPAEVTTVLETNGGKIEWATRIEWSVLVDKLKHGLNHASAMRIFTEFTPTLDYDKSAIDGKTEKQRCEEEEKYSSFSQYIV